MPHAPAFARHRAGQRGLAATLAIIAIVIAAGAISGLGCGVDEPGRITTNERATAIVYDADLAIVPSGTVTVEDDTVTLTVAIDDLPILLTSNGTGDLVYEGWISFADTGEARAFISTGRFTIVAGPDSDPEYPTGDVAFRYNRLSGSFTVTEGGDELAAGQPLPDSLDFSETRFFLAIEPNPDSSPDPGLSHLLIGKTDLTSPGTVDLVIPVNEGQPTVGDLSTIDGEAVVNVSTGEFQLFLQRTPFFSRSEPPTDPGLIYQAWFIDEDDNRSRYQSIQRFNPNAVGDAVIVGALNPGDGDGDGVPEPFDFERVVISIEPDALTAQQPVGQGRDTSPEIFSVAPYRSGLPDIRE